MENKTRFCFITNEENQIIGANLFTDWLSQDYFNPKNNQFGGLIKVFDSIQNKLDTSKTSDRTREMINNKGVVHVFGSKGFHIEDVSNFAIYDGIVRFAKPEPKVYKPKNIVGVRKGAVVILNDGFKGIIIKYYSNIAIQVKNSKELLPNGIEVAEIRTINISEIVEVVSDLIKV